MLAKQFIKETLRQADKKKSGLVLIYHLIIFELFPYRITVNLTYQFLTGVLLTLIILGF